MSTPNTNEHACGTPCPPACLRDAACHASGTLDDTLSDGAAHDAGAARVAARLAPVPRPAPVPRTPGTRAARLPVRARPVRHAAHTGVAISIPSPLVTEWLTADEATAYLRFPSRDALYQAVHRGQVPAHRIGRRLRFRRSELDALARAA